MPTLDILRQRNFWAAALGQFCSNYPFYFMIVWLPLYLVHERHQSMQQMSVEAACYYLAFAIMAPITGWIADACISSGWDVSQVRKTGMAVGHSLIAAGVLMCSAANDRLALAGLIVMGLGSGFVGPNVYVFAQTLAGPSGRGQMDRIPERLRQSRGRGRRTAHRLDRRSQRALRLRFSHLRRFRGPGWSVLGAVYGTSGADSMASRT